MKYAIVKFTEEIRNKKDIKPGCTSSSENQEVIELFETKGAALEALKGYTSSIQQMSGYYLINEYAVAEQVETDLFADIWEFSTMKIEVVARESFEILATFDNMAAAEAFECEEDSYISFI